jgi:hypothetical protein
MTNEERDIITQFIARVGGAQSQPGFSGSVPATTQPALPPVDRDADVLIADQFQRYPESRYRITQLAFVQEHALVEAQNRIKRLEWEVQQAQQAAQQAQQAQQSAPRQSQQGGGFFSGLFGGSRPQAAPPPQGGPSSAWNQGAAQQQPYYQQAAPPQPQYPPSYQSGVLQRGGSGFLGSALTTAAGVAGGMVAGEALMNMFSGHRGSGGGEFAGGWGGGSPWAAPPVAPAQDYVETGNWDNGGNAPPASSQDYVDSGTWDQPAAPDQSSLTDNTDNTPDQSSWTDNSGGGWDDNSGGGSTDDTF